MIDVEKFMHALWKERPVFHSEADFQHAFAWQIHHQIPKAKVRLEYPQELYKWIYIDIWVSHESQSLAIELKYKTAEIEINHNSEIFHLKDQSAQNLGRYDFLKDVERLENICEQNPNTTRLAIILTNEKKYWEESNEVTNDKDFRLHQDRQIHGHLKWSPTESKRHLKPIYIRGNYKLNWQGYSKFLHKPRGQFRYLAIRIE